MRSIISILDCLTLFVMWHVQTHEHSELKQPFLLVEPVRGYPSIPSLTALKVG